MPFRAVHDSIGTSGLVAMTSASHAEGRQFDPGLVYFPFPPNALVAHKTILKNMLPTSS